MAVRILISLAPRSATTMKVLCVDVAEILIVRSLEHPLQVSPRDMTLMAVLCRSSFVRRLMLESSTTVNGLLALTWKATSLTTSALTTEVRYAAIATSALRIIQLLSFDRRLAIKLVQCHLLRALDTLLCAIVRRHLVIRQTIHMLPQRLETLKPLKLDYRFNHNEISAIPLLQDELSSDDELDISG